MRVKPSGQFLQLQIFLASSASSCSFVKWAFFAFVLAAFGATETSALVVFTETKAALFGFGAAFNIKSSSSALARNFLKSFARFSSSLLIII